MVRRRVDAARRHCGMAVSLVITRASGTAVPEGAARCRHHPSGSSILPDHRRRQVDADQEKEGPGTPVPAGTQKGRGRSKPHASRPGCDVPRASNCFDSIVGSAALRSLQLPSRLCSQRYVSHLRARRFDVSDADRRSDPSRHSCDMKFGFIAKHRGIRPVTWLCAALGVSRSGLHAWLGRALSSPVGFGATSLRRASLAACIASSC